MYRGLRTALKAIALGLVVVVLSAFVATTVGEMDLSSPSDPDTPAKDSFMVGQQLVAMKDIRAVSVRDSKKASAVSLPKLSSMTELLGIFDKMGLIYSAQPGAAVDMAEAEKFLDAPQATAAGAERSPSEDSAAHSETNSQVSGVEEGDIVKTDGRYVYAAGFESLRIIEVNGADMRLVGEISQPNKQNAYEYLTEMYLAGDYLVTASIRSEELDGDVFYPDAGGRVVGCMWYPQRQMTVFTVYDITDRANPRQARRFEVEGHAVATRMIGNTFYFVSNKYVYNIPADDMGEADVLPVYRDTCVSDALSVVPVDEISYIPGSLESTYMMVGAFDVTTLEEAFMETILGAGNTIYMNESSLYITKQTFHTDTVAENGDVVSIGSGVVSTEIHRFAIDGASLSYTGMGTAEGYPLSQYSMDEYNGYFRIATSDWDSGNRMTVFDADMNAVGMTEDLAKGEQIYSVRFMGDIGYMVTYRTVDPLFAVDLSDPANPTVLGELKIPGFSQYLHPVGDGLLVGFGRHTTETYIKNDDGTETVTGTQDMGLKISLFDVSDPRDPREVDTLLLGRSSWTSAFDNPRSLMVDRARSLFGFAMEKSEEISAHGWRHSGGYMLVSVEQGRLVTRAYLESADEQYSAYDARLCYVGDTLYTVTRTGLEAYDYNTFQMLGTLVF